MEYKIQEGDIVNVYWERIEGEYEVEVLYTPQDTGDSWRFRRKDGTIVYVNSFSKMVKIPRD